MNHYFCSLEELPETLSKEETMMYFKKYKNGDKTARDALISHNLKFVVYIVNIITSKFVCNYNTSDLVSIGLIGLIKAIDTFDLDKNFTFTTYADKCIKNEIFMFFRRNNKHSKNISLDAIVLETTKTEKNCSYVDLLLDKNVNIEKQIMDNDIMYQIMRIISSLPEKDKKIITMYFGLNNGKRYNQEEIAREFNISQSYLSRKLKQILEVLKTMCLMKGIIEYSSGLFEDKPRKARVKKA